MPERISCGTILHAERPGQQPGPAMYTWSAETSMMAPQPHTGPSCTCRHVSRLRRPHFRRCLFGLPLAIVAISLSSWLQVAASLPLTKGRAFFLPPPHAPPIPHRQSRAARGHLFCRHHSEGSGTETTRSPPHPPPPLSSPAGRVSPPPPSSSSSSSSSRGGLDRQHALKTLGLASIVTGLVLGQPSSSLLRIPAASAAMNKEDPMIMGPSGGRGYMTWRKFSEVEGRTKDQNKSQRTYPIRFVTYLSRILVNFDEGDKLLWEKLAKDIPFTYNKEQVAETRRMQFASFADSVEIGLYDYQGPQGVERLFSLLQSRYGQRGADARRQLAILFSFVDTYQPVLSISQLLAQTDNAGVASFKVISGGTGYTGMEQPRVTLSKPVATGATPAKAQVILRDRGNIVRVHIKDPGCIYIHDIPPEVVIPPPPPGPNARQAEGYAVLNGKGGVREVLLTDPGAGYSSSIPVPLTFLPRGDGEVELGRREEAGGPATEEAACGGSAKAYAVVDREVAEVKVLEGGTGYVLQLGAQVTIDPPLLSGGEINGQAAKAVAVLAPTIPNTGPPPAALTPMMFNSLTAQLQELLPANTALVYDVKAGKYRVQDEKLLRTIPPAMSMMDPIFGSVGRSPLAKESTLRPDDYARLALSGGCCICIVRTSLTPLEIVKTKLQARPDIYKGWVDGIAQINSEGGSNPFYKGVELTSMTGFLLGMMGFGFNEMFRRLLMEWIGKGSAEVFEIPIILLSSAMATVITAVATCPMEAVRIRVMATRQEVEFGGFLRMGREMVDKGGVLSLYDGLEPLLFREVPFIMTKFLVFDLTQDVLFHFLPAARETLTTSLAISFVAGLAAGVAGAVTGCPADAVLTRVNSRPTATDWRAMVKEMLGEPGGWRNLFAGMNVRMVFFSLVISIQFFLYDWFRNLFGVASDDLTVVLDVINKNGGGS